MAGQFNRWLEVRLACDGHAATFSSTLPYNGIWTERAYVYMGVRRVVLDDSR